MTLINTIEFLYCNTWRTQYWRWGQCLVQSSLGQIGKVDHSSKMFILLLFDAKFVQC